jgi:CDP-paratose 2-epimerase
LVGSEAVRFFADTGLEVVGIDNDMRSHFFGGAASTSWCRERLEEEVPGYTHLDIDIRDSLAIDNTFAKYGEDISLVIHTAAQPSHDWAARDPMTDFSVNATGTLVVLEATRKYCPDAVFVFTSTNKVYGDQPNSLPLQERDTRFEIQEGHQYANGIDETMSIDSSMHSLFGASKVAADVLVQEYGRYFDMKTGVFRGGCLTGPRHSGAELHGFLSYLMKCAVTDQRYSVFGHKGKQVRDNIHSYDLVNAFHHFFLAPRSGEVYNIGGGRSSNCSMLEAIELCQEIAGKELKWTYVDEERKGDHMWWISDLTKFRTHYPDWNVEFGVEDILREIFEYNLDQWTAAVGALR